MGLKPARNRNSNSSGSRRKIRQAGIGRIRHYRSRQEDLSPHLIAFDQLDDASELRGGQGVATRGKSMKVACPGA